MADNDELRNYLTMGDSPDEDSIRRDLARQGPSFVNTIVQHTISKLRYYRESFDHFVAWPVAMMGVKQVFERASKLLVEIINSSSQGGSAVAEQLLLLTEHRDAGMRALAIIFTGLPGIPFASTVASLQKHFKDDEDLVVKIAAAVLLQGQRESATLVPANIRTEAKEFITAYIKCAHEETGSISNFSNDDLEEDEEEPTIHAMKLAMMKDRKSTRLNSSHRL